MTIENEEAKQKPRGSESALTGLVMRRDGTDRLGRLLYGRAPNPKEYIGGSDAKLLHDAADELTNLRMKSAQNTARLQIMWTWLQELNKDTGIEPPKEYFDWFDNDGVPKKFDA